MQKHLKKNSDDKLCTVQWLFGFIIFNRLFNQGHNPILYIVNSVWCPLNSPCRQPYNSYNVSLENLVLDQVVITKLILFFILITYLVDNVLIL